MPEPSLFMALSGWPSGALAVVGSMAVAALAFFGVRRLDLVKRLAPDDSRIPPVRERVARLLACADYSADYGLGALPDFPPCAQDAVLARAAQLAVENPNPEELTAALDADFDRWINESSGRGEARRRVESALPLVGLFCLLVGFLGVGAMVNGWLTPGLPGSLLLLASILVGLTSTAMGSITAARQGSVDPASVLDRQLIAAAMVALRRGRTPRELEAMLLGLLPAAERSGAQAKARAA